MNNVIQGPWSKRPTQTEEANEDLLKESWDYPQRDPFYNDDNFPEG